MEAKRLRKLLQEIQGGESQASAETKEPTTVDGRNPAGPCIYHTTIISRS